MDEELTSIPLVSPSIGDDYNPAICIKLLSKKTRRELAARRMVAVWGWMQPIYARSTF